MAEEKIIDFSKILAIMKKNFTVIVRDKTRLLPLLLFPIFMILIFGYTTGNIPKHISTAIVDYDNSGMSQDLIKQISASNVFSITNLLSTEGEGRKMLDKGEIRVLIVISQNLEKDIGEDRQSSVTIIVDESDSAVSQTARQTLSQIISRAGDEISLTKYSGYQHSVAEGARQLEMNSMQVNYYGAIDNYIESALMEISAAKKISDSSRDRISDTLPDASLYVPPSPSGQNTSAVNTNYYFVQYPIGYAAARAQLYLFQRSSALLDAGSRSLQQASILAKGADESKKDLEGYNAYEKNSAKPRDAILLFTNSDAKGVLKPLIYQEKPAYGTGKRPIDFTIAAIIALTIFQGAIMGMGRAIAGEKREGSLTRVFLTPTSNATIISGTLLFYILFELFRSAFILTVAVALFHVSIEGSLLSIALILAVYAGVSTSIGMILSSMVKTEQQYMGMSMLVSMPTTFLSGAFFPLQAMPKVLQVIAAFLPVTYAAEALRGVMIKGFPLAMIANSLFVLVIFLAGALALVFMIFKRDIE